MTAYTTAERFEAAVLEALAKCRDYGLTKDADAATAIKVALDREGLRVVRQAGR